MSSPGLGQLLILVGAVWALLRLPGVLWPVRYRRGVNRLLEMPEIALQGLGLGLFVAGGIILSMVIASISAAEIAGALVAFLLMAGGLFWIFPNLVKDLSRMLFFNRHPAWTRLVCLVAVGFGVTLVWIGWDSLR